MFKIKIITDAIQYLGELAFQSKITSKEDVEVLTVGKSLVIKSPDNSRWRITIDNTGVITGVKL